MRLLLDHSRTVWEASYPQALGTLTPGISPPFTNTIPSASSAFRMASSVSGVGWLRLPSHIVIVVGDILARRASSRTPIRNAALAILHCAILIFVKPYPRRPW